ncbi:MAG TPA: PIG-L family deacetylase, partial [Acidimicrobiales bacterium]|nr:PIG-L family deacetylase [Acidimicrobiales bacterium]
MPDPLCLLTVHAHPDDEASKGAGTVARYHAEGIRTVLVCCTGGEEGEILNPALDTPEVRGRIAEVRKEELARAAEIIGYDEVVMLGYRDSGMAGSEANANPDSFAQAPLEQAVERLVAIVRRTRPQVMVVYGDEQTSYPHPDHLRVHDIGVAAFRAAGDPDRYPGAGEAWQPFKLYYTVFSVARFREIHHKFEELGLESPFDDEWRRRWEGVPEDVASASVDISAVADVRRQALLAHATQVDPNSLSSPARCYRWGGPPVGCAPALPDADHPGDRREQVRLDLAVGFGHDHRAIGRLDQGQPVVVVGMDGAHHLGRQPEP